MKLHAIKLVIFDCDGVLVDSETIGKRVFAEEVVKLGVPLSTTEAVERFAGIQMAEAIRQVESMLGSSVPANFEQNYRARSFDAFREELKPIAGVHDVLDQLDRPFCVASNGPRNKIELNLSITGLLPYFQDRIYSAYEIGVWKPDPGFYLGVVQDFGVDASECMVIDDTVFGATAAFHAGMHVLGYAGGSARRRQDLAPVCHQTIDSMGDLLAMIPA